MRAAIALGTLLALTAPTGALAASPPPVRLSSAQWQTVLNGKRVLQFFPTSRSTLKDVVIAERLDASAEAVWGVVTDYLGYPQLYPQIVESTVSHLDGAVLHHRTVAAPPWPLPRVWVNSRVEHSADHRYVHWERLEGSLREFEGSWQLIPEGQGTVLVYSSRVDPGVPFVPPWLIEWGNAQLAPQVIGNVRRAILTRGLR